MSVLATDTQQNFRAFLDAHLDQEMLRFTTAGSVDDGKSTLIGRLLHDTKSVYEDQLATIRASRVNRAGNGHVDLSLLTDGLKAEREQGITIDVAYRYFSTTKRKFIIADTPGHEQYTRNMATGASTADVAIVLIDARAFVKLGTLLPQSRRHTYIASLLRIPHVVAAINKMDLVDYSEAVYTRISADFRALAAQLGVTSVEVIPVSALTGDNVVEPSTAMPWYAGPTLLHYLETVPLTIAEAAEGPLRFPVQLVVRPDATFRGFAGRVERGEVRPGQRVRALPSGRTTRVKTIVTYDGNLTAATFPQSVTLELEDEIDLSRGEMLIAEDEATPHIATRFTAMVVWMAEAPLTPGKTYLAKHTTRTVRATVRAIRYAVDINTPTDQNAHRPATALAMNDIAEVEFDTALPLFFDLYRDNRELGALIIIDPVTNATVGAAMLSDATPAADEPAAAHAAFVWLCNQPTEAASLCASLREQGTAAVLIDDPLIPESSMVAAVRALQLAGVTAVSARAEIGEATLAELAALGGPRMTETLTHPEALTAEALVAEVIAAAQSRDLCLTSSFQTEDMVVLHLLLQQLPNVPVIFLETGYHFADLIAYRDRIVRDWNLNLINALPTTTLEAHEREHGLLHIVEPARCCAIRKVEPLMRSLEPYAWWFTGLRREQSPTRANLQKIEDHRLPTGKLLKKVSILADWTWPQVEAYAEAHNIPRLALYEQGYTSIGCEPCTAIPAAGADARSGRWGGKKLECGIHTFSEKA